MNFKQAVEVAIAKDGTKQKRDLAEACGVTRSTLSRAMKNNSYTRQLLEKSAEFFGLKVSEFAALGE